MPLLFRLPPILLLLLGTNLLLGANLPAEPTVDQTLDALEAAGKNLKSLTADVTLDETDDMANESTKTGKLLLARSQDGETRVRVNFSEFRSGQRVIAQRREYVLDGEYLVRRDYDLKKQQTTRVRKPGEKVDLLKLGEGPFPLPIGQSKEAVYKQFDVKSLAPEAEDATNVPDDTVRLRLTPKDGTRLAKKFSTIDVWVRRGEAFPVKIETVDANQTSTVGTTMTNIKLNDDLPADAFKLDKLPQDWSQEDDSLVN